MANWFTRAVDKITPWDRGGEIQRRQERKKKEEEEQNYNQSAPSRAPQQSGGLQVTNSNNNQRISVDGFEPKPQKPVNVFEDLNKIMNFNKPSNAVDIINREANKPVETPRPGAVVTPTRMQSKLTVDNTGRDARFSLPNGRTVNTSPSLNPVNNTPVPADTRAWGTKLFDSVNIRDSGRSWANPGQQRNPNFAQRNLSPTGIFNIGKEIVQGTVRTPIETYQTLDKNFATIKENERLKEAGYTGADREDIARQNAPSRTWNPTGWQARIFGDQPVQPLQDSAKELSDLVQETTGKKPSESTLTALLFALNLVPSSFAGKSGKVDDIAEGVLRNVDDVLNVPGAPLIRRPTNIIDDLLTDADITDINTTQIPVTKNIPISQAEGIAENVNVRNLTEPKPLIREIGGDAPVATPNRAIADNANQIRRTEAENTAKATTPNPRTALASSGLTPPTPKFLGQADGVTKIEVDTERAMLDDALANKEINKTQYKLANKQLDEIVPSDAKPGTGRKIEIKQPAEIKSMDNTDVPTNLPETPGTVRVTSSTAPNNAKSEVVAQQLPPIPKVGSTLPDGKVVTKRDVQRLRNENKNAKAMVKQQEKNAELLAQVDGARSPNVITRDNFGNYESDARYLSVEHGEAVSRGDFDTAQRIESRVAEMPTPGAAPLTKKLQDSRLQGQSSATDFAPTGKFKVGKKGNVSEVATREAEAKRGADTMARTSTDDLIKTLSEKKRLTQEDSGNIIAALDNLKKANPETYRGVREFQILENMRLQGNSDAGRQLGLIAKVMRKTASGQELTNRWGNNIRNALDDPTKLSSEKLGQIQAANNKFADMRDNAARLEEQYKKSPSTANLESFKTALKAAQDADMAAKNLEVRVAKDTLKGSKAENAARVINDLEREAELNMMDYLTAGQLSGPATGMRNLYGVELAGLENRVGANIRAKVTKAIFGENVGGYSAKGGIIGRKEGFSKMVGDASNRTKYSRFNPFKQSRNFATTINSLGESGMHAQKQSRLLKYYENQVKAKGLTGQNLKNDAEFLRLTDPDGMGEVFMDSVMKSSGLSGIYKKTQKFETNMAAQIAAKLGNVLPPNASDKIAKGITRVAFGYPTATGNFIMQSGKRVLAPTVIFNFSFWEAGVKALRGEKFAAALAFDRGLKEAGSGAAAHGTGVMLSQAGLISGFYPEDEDERQRWTDEDKSELSIKIGDTWHPIPQGFGMLGLPLLVGSLLESGGPEEVFSAFTTRENLFKLSPADQTKSFLEVLSGGSTENQDKSFVSSTIRSLIPAGSFLNQTAKGLDDTVNDTTTKDFWSNVRDQVLSGIPIANEAANIPDKLSSTGEPIKNPNLAETYLGAKSVEQKDGVENSKKVDQRINDALKDIDKYGLLSDPNMEGVLDGTGLEASVKANAGRQLDESDIKALQENLVKGVSSEGTDTAYLEKEQYDTNLSALKLKRDLMNSDPTTKPSSLKDIDNAIKRGEVYKENKTPYQDISDYKSIGVEDWRKMGIPPGDDDYDEEYYDPDMYEKLWQLDQKMTKAGVSYNTKGLDKNKYYLEDKKGSGKGGRGGSGSNKISGDFGRLREGKFAPKVQQYATIDAKSGSVPVIGVKRPNIVNKITQSR